MQASDGLEVFTFTLIISGLKRSGTVFARERANGERVSGKTPESIPLP